MDDGAATVRIRMRKSPGESRRATVVRNEGVVMATMPEILQEESFFQAVHLVQKYFGLTNETGRHVGASFETIGGRWDDAATINEVTPSDLIALATLSVEVKGSSAVALLDPEMSSTITALLAQIPPDLTLVDDDAPAILDDSGPAAELWSVVRKVDGFGPTRTSKLLARKRPRLIPVFDSVVAAELGLKGPLDHWTVMRDLVTQDEGALWQRAERIRAEVGLDDAVTPLRIIDIVLWRHGKDTGRVVADDS